MGLPWHFRLREGARLAQNAQALAAFLDIPVDTAQKLVATDHLFAD
jgi:hypothetical protein